MASTSPIGRLGLRFWRYLLRSPRATERSMTDQKETPAANAIHIRGRVVFFLAVSSLLLSSCADLKMPSDQPASNRHGRPGSGDCTFRRGIELGFWA
jgi:hypothetical protein